MLKTGASDHEHGRDTDAASFYEEFERVGARYVSTLRAKSEAAAGSRESEDLRRLAGDFEAEEPLNVEEPTGRAGDLVILDMLDGDDLTNEERAGLSADYEAFTKAGLKMFGAYMDVQARQREAVAA